MNSEEVLNKLVEWINKTIIKPMASSPNDDLSEQEIAQIKEILSQSSELEELLKEVKDSIGLADVIQNVMTPQLCPIDTKELGQNAYFVYSMMKSDRGKIEQLQSELADTRLERDNYFDELHAKRHKLASVKSELEKVKGEREAEGYEFMRVSTDNKRLREVVEGIENADTETEYSEVIVDGVGVPIQREFIYKETIDKLIASLERGK